MELISQPFTSQLGNRLIELLDSPDYHTLNIAVAFAKNSGVLRIKNSLERFRERGGVVNVYVGVDLGVTSYEALSALLLCTDSLNVVHSEKGQTFHTKIYHFEGESAGLVIVGSNNLTGGGLWTNFESSTLIPIDSSEPSNSAISSAVNDYISSLTTLTDSFMPISVKTDIDRLLENGYIFKEITHKVRQAKANKRTSDQERLFGNGAPAPLPRIITPKREKETDETASPDMTAQSEAQQNGGIETIWFETKRLTGGSRNILDLSMKSLIERGNPAGTSFDLGHPKYMRGGGEFFGINPTDTEIRKDITLNFEGIDYTGNTILFPSGDSANGTWRLQIKGSHPSQGRITDSFSAKGEEHYLVKKVVTFTKIHDDYYSISVFPESELKNFETTSRILARNGSTRSAKRLGLL